MPSNQPDQGVSEPPSGQRNDDLQALALAFGRASASGTQMTPGQYFRIAAELRR